MFKSVTRIPSLTEGAERNLTAAAAAVVALVLLTLVPPAHAAPAPARSSRRDGGLAR